MGKTFRKIVLCSTNDHPAHKNDKIRGWVENNGGRFTLELTPAVTHMVTSMKAWKRDAPIVKAARRFRTVKIVHLNWLEESLMSRTRKPLATGKYDWTQRHHKRRKAEKVQAQNDLGQKHELYLSTDVRKQDVMTAKTKTIEDAGVTFDKACKDSDAELTAAGYHLYLDPAHFPHSIILTRPDIHDNRLQQHRLKLYESDSTPHTYAAFTTHVDRDGRVTHDTVAPINSTFDLAKDAFKLHFKLRTGVEWESAPLSNGVKRETSATRERTLSHDGAGDWTYQLEYEVEEWRKGARKPSVTMLVSEEDAGERWDVRAKTPDSGW